MQIPMWNLHFFGIINLMKKTSEIAKEYKALTEKDYEAFINEYASDERSAVIKNVESVRKKLTALENEKKRMYMMYVNILTVHTYVV